MTVKEIDLQLKDLYEQLKNVKGTKTEVYTRIVGYYRNMRDWNLGKKEEGLLRVPFDVAVSMARRAAG